MSGFSNKIVLQYVWAVYTLISSSKGVIVGGGERYEQKMCTFGWQHLQYLIYPLLSPLLNNMMKHPAMRVLEREIRIVNQENISTSS